MRALLILALLATPAMAAPDEAKPGTGKDRMICKREVPIGSLIASRKRCMTKAQWDALEQDGNDVARKMVYDNMGRPPGQ